MVEGVIFGCVSILLLGYVILIGKYRSWFLQVKPFKLPKSVILPTKFSVIIPARNEEAIIEVCLTSVLQQNYPRQSYEVIVINDHSTDDTAAVVANMQKQYSNLHLIQLSDFVKDKKLNSYKKTAIANAISNATGDWIVTTDADCVVPKNWLQTYAAFIADREVVFVAAPVSYLHNGSFLSLFQCLDFMTLQGITAAAVDQDFHSMCNGANLAYNKNVFYEAGGFTGIDNIASGDDMLLMHKIYRLYPGKIGFLLSGDATVTTQPMGTWNALLNQRIRWASKAKSYDDKRIFWVLVLVYLFNLSFLVLPVVAIWYSQLWLYWIALLSIKTLIELSFLYPVAVFFKDAKLLWWFPVMQPVHILYTIIAGWLGRFGKYTWKDRQVA